ncbi:MAG: FixH family protein [Bdellovibrionota bacterium]
MKHAAIVSFSLFGSLFGILASSACGPMNSPKKSLDVKAPNELGQLAGEVGATRVSKGKKFYVYSEISGSSKAQAGAEASSCKAYAYYDEVVKVKFASTGDLGAPSSVANVSVNYWMPKMPEMGVESGAVSRQPDGTFSVGVIFSMPGLWEIIIKIQDGDLQDEYTFEVDVCGEGA